MVTLDVLCNTCVSVLTKTSLWDGKRIRQLRKSCTPYITQEPQDNTETVHWMGVRGQRSPFSSVIARLSIALAKAGTRMHWISPLPAGRHRAVVAIDGGNMLLADPEVRDHAHDMLPGLSTKRGASHSSS